MIACIRIADFVTTLERKDHTLPPQRPVLVRAPSPNGNRVLAACSLAARDGVLVNMTVRYAQMLSPDACVLPTNPVRYRLVHDAIFDLLCLFSDKIEMADPAWGDKPKPRRKAMSLPAAHLISYLDFDTLKLPDIQALTVEIHRLMRSQHGMEVAIGVACNKFTALTAVHHARIGQTVTVPQRQEAGFLAAHPITLLPMEADMARRLHLLGIHSLGQFAALPAGAVLAQFGKSGRALHRLARGLDETPVIAMPKRVEHRASHIFDDPVADLTVISQGFERLSAAVVKPLAMGGSACRELRLSVGLANGASYETLFVLRRPTRCADHLQHTALELFQKAGLMQAVVSLALTITDVVAEEARQLDLFSESATQQGQPQVLQDVTARYGDCLFRVATADVSARLTEARFQLQPAASA